MYLRRSRPDLHRPFPAPLYPVTPILTVALSAVVVAGAVQDEPVPSLCALGFIALSFPVYWFGYRKRIAAHKATTNGADVPAPPRQFVELVPFSA